MKRLRRLTLAYLATYGIYSAFIRRQVESRREVVHTCGERECHDINHVRIEVVHA